MLRPMRSTSYTENQFKGNYLRVSILTQMILAPRFTDPSIRRQSTWLKGPTRRCSAQTDRTGPGEQKVNRKIKLLRANDPLGQHHRSSSCDDLLFLLKLVSLDEHKDHYRLNAIT